MSAELQLHQDLVDENSHRRAAGLDHVVGGFTVQGIPGFIERTQARQGVVNLQQGSGRVMPHPSQDILWQGVQVDHMPTLLHVSTTDFTQDSSPASRQDTVVMQAQLVDHILLDNMSLDDLREAVAMRGERTTPMFEASGGVTLETIRDIAATGVDFISVGALTHSAPALDIGLDFTPVEIS